MRARSAVLLALVLGLCGFPLADVARGAGLLPTVMTLSSQHNPSVFGQSVDFTASLSVLALAQPSGDVTFTVNGQVAGSVAVAGGVATLPLSNLVPGSYTIKATYGGDTNYGPGEATLNGGQMVSQDPTSLTISASESSPTPGDTVVFAASVNGVPPGGGTPTGQVSFQAGPTSLGTATLSAGRTQVTMVNFPAGAVNVVATYQGDTDFGTSTGSLTVGSATASPSAAHLTPSPTPTRRPTPSPSPSKTSIPSPSATVPTTTVIPTATASPVVPTETLTFSPTPPPASPTAAGPKKNTNLLVVGLVLVLAVGGTGLLLFLTRRNR